jgi:superfamily II DNA or RNA helicase
VLIKDKIYIRAEGLGRNVTGLCNLFTHKNPEYYKNKKLKFSCAGVPATLLHYRFENINNERYLLLPRGGLERVKEFYLNNKMPLRILDERLTLPEIDCVLCPGVVVEEQQEKIVDILIKNDGGLVQMETAGGKSIGALAYISRIKQPTLILVHKHILKDQWINNIKKVLTGNFTLGDYSEGTFQHGDIVVGLVQTVHTLIDEGIPFLDRFGALVIDECLDTETLINTPTGLDRLKNIQVGSVVVTPRGTYAKVTHVKKVKKEAFKYNIAGGGYLIASKDHKVPTLDSSRKVVLTAIGSCSHILFVKRPNIVSSIIDIEFMDKRLYESRVLLSTESLGERELIDITIDDPEHLFVANGIAVSNCHHVSSDTYLKVINNMAAKYKVGLTATVKRKDQKDILIYDVLGPMLLQIDAGEIKHRVTSFEYGIINSNIKMIMPVRKRWTGRMREDMPDPTELISKLITNIERNAIIINTSMKNIEDGYFPLILSDRVEHCKFLTDALISKGYNAKLLIGDKKSKKGEELKNLQTDTSIQVIVATTSKAYEGLDIPRLSSLILTCPSSNMPNLRQKLGRIRRHVDGKKLPIVLDIVDNLVYMEEINEEGERVVKYPLLYSSYGRIKYYNKLLKEYSSSV